MIHVTSQHASISVVGSEECGVLQKFISRSRVNSEPANVDLHLERSDQGLILKWSQGAQKPLKFYMDYQKELLKHRSFPAPKQGAFNQALGKKTRTVIDATGGWGNDAILMCMQGYKVTIIERLPLMAALIEDGLNRLSKSLPFLEGQLSLPEVVCTEAKNFLSSSNGHADCVYLDPMFPAKKKKSAASNKNMQLLQWLAGPDMDADEVAVAALERFSRVAVKRPDYASPLAEEIIGKPSTQFSSKLVHYDVYVSPKA